MDAYEKLERLEAATSLLEQAQDELQGTDFNDLIDEIQNAISCSDDTRRDLQDELHEDNEAVWNEQEREYYRAVY